VGPAPTGQPATRHAPPHGDGGRHHLPAAQATRSLGVMCVCVTDDCDSTSQLQTAPSVREGRVLLAVMLLGLAAAAAAVPIRAHAVMPAGDCSYVTAATTLLSNGNACMSPCRSRLCTRHAEKGVGGSLSL
jgi:hypothetical protein